MIKGYKVYLRSLERKDLNILYKMSNEEKVSKYNISSSDRQENGYEKILRKALSIINEKNVLVGFITYKESSYLKRVYSIGITIGSRYWDRKYGQDSIKALLRYLFEELNARRVELEVIKSNLRAISCYKKCGFICESIKESRVYIDGEYIDTIIMRILREEVIDI
jgi:RimJ/RimL family protein N-acetyltransferase